MKKLFEVLSSHLEKVHQKRFETWTKFLGRKMFFGMIAMLLLTAAFGSMLMLALFCGSVDSMKALGTELWTGFCTAIVALFGTATAGNVIEHKEKTKQAVAAGTEAPAQ